MKDYEPHFIDHTLSESGDSPGELKCLAERLCSIYIKETQSEPRSVRSVQQGFYQILCNLYYVFLLSNRSERWCVVYSRNKNDYRNRKPGYNIIIKVIDWLVDNEHCDQIKGFQDRTTGVRRLSRLRYSESLRCTFEAMGKKVSVGRRTNHLIRVKTAKDKALYPDDEAVRAVFGQRIGGHNSCLEKMTRINQVRRQHTVTYRNQNLPVNDLYRVFNDDGFGSGGRFYGEFIQNQPKSVRAGIMIEEECVSELDYSGLHPRILYDVRNIEMNGDPYTIDGFDRGIVKQAFQRVINNPTKGLAKNSIRRMLEGKGTFDKNDPERILNGILEKHREVIDFNGNGVCLGSRLQRIDSEIALEVMYHFARKNIVCIGVHDSFLVQEKYENELREVMEEQYQEVLIREFVKQYERDNGKGCKQNVWGRLKFSPVIK